MNTQERNRLVMDNYGLIGKVLKGLLSIPEVSRMGWDAAYSAGVEALIRAVELYDCGKNFRFSTYAFPAIRNAIIKEARSSGVIYVPANIKACDPRGRRQAAANRASRIYSLSHPGVFQKLCMDPVDELADSEEAEKVCIAIRKHMTDLEPDQENVIRRIFFGGSTCMGMAREEGTYHEVISNRLKRSLAKLKEALTSSGYSFAS